VTLLHSCCCCCCCWRGVQPSTRSLRHFQVSTTIRKLVSMSVCVSTCLSVCRRQRVTYQLRMQQQQQHCRYSAAERSIDSRRHRQAELMTDKSNKYNAGQSDLLPHSTAGNDALSSTDNVLRMSAITIISLYFYALEYVSPES